MVYYQRKLLLTYLDLSRLFDCIERLNNTYIVHVRPCEKISVSISEWNEEKAYNSLLLHFPNTNYIGC